MYPLFHILYIDFNNKNDDVQCREAAIPCMTLIMGANLLRGYCFFSLFFQQQEIVHYESSDICKMVGVGAGVKGSKVSRSVIIGIIAVRSILLPALGIGVVMAARKWGLIGSDNKLYQFVLMLQFAVPPAMAVGNDNDIRFIPVYIHICGC